VAYFTQDHKYLFLESRKTLKKSIGAGISYTYRKSFYETHAFRAEFQRSQVDDTIALLNSNYYRNGNPSQPYASVSYSFNSDHRDVQAYPLHGYQFTGYVEKTGLGLGDDVNQVASNITFSYYTELTKNLFLSNFTSGLVSSPPTQPYNFYTALGHQKQFIRGYEIYVIEGPKFVLNKTTLKKKIFSHAWHLENMPINQFKYFPLSIYLKGYFDMGYVQNYPYYENKGINDRLSNRFLGGTGAGLDLVILYDTVMRFEYTFTREQTHGFFFNLKKEF